jgi:hypothetical protein
MALVRRGLVERWPKSKISIRVPTRLGCGKESSTEIESQVSFGRESVHYLRDSRDWFVESHRRVAFFQGIEGGPCFCLESIGGDGCSCPCRECGGECKAGVPNPT